MASCLSEETVLVDRAGGGGGPGGGPPRTSFRQRSVFAKTLKKRLTR